MGRGVGVMARHLLCEHEANQILMRMEETHEEYILFIRKFRDVVRTQSVKDELQAVAETFHSGDVECLYCDSAAMVGHASSWANHDDEDKYEGVICSVFGPPTTNNVDRHERCLCMDDMQRMCSNNNSEDPVYLRNMLMRVYRLFCRKVRVIVISKVVEELAREMDSLVITVRVLNKQYNSVTRELMYEEETRKRKMDAKMTTSPPSVKKSLLSGDGDGSVAKATPGAFV